MHSQKCKKKQIIIFHVAELEAANSKMEMQIHLLTLRARIVVTFIVNDGDFFYYLNKQKAMRTSVNNNNKNNKEKKENNTAGEKKKNLTAAITEFDVIQRVRKTTEATVTITQI